MLASKQGDANEASWSSLSLIFISGRKNFVFRFDDYIEVEMEYGQLGIKISQVRNSIIFLYNWNHFDRFFNFFFNKSFRLFSFDIPFSKLHALHWIYFNIIL